MNVRKPMEQATSEDFFNIIIDLMVKNTDGSLLSQDFNRTSSISKFGTVIR